MKLLRKTIRRVILEEVCAGASAKIQQGLDEIEKRNLKIKAKIYSDGYDIFIYLDRPNKDTGKQVVGGFEVSKSRLCPAYITMFTDLDGYLIGTGIGAVMYDVAVEVATSLHGYLACDRATVSGDAKPMWRYYNASDDYEAFQMDTRNGHYTPDDPGDDCKQTIFHRDEDIPMKADPETYKEEFMASPFTKAYRKKRMTTIECLGDRYIEEMG